MHETENTSCPSNEHSRGTTLPGVRSGKRPDTAREECVPRGWATFWESVGPVRAFLISQGLMGKLTSLKDLSKTWRKENMIKQKHP